MPTFEEVSANVTANQQLYKDNLNWSGLKQIYGLHQQALNGDAPTEHTSNISGIAQFKWNAWNAQRGKAQSDAQDEYIQFVLETGLYPN
jgi:acyl-CoA-binding protein